MKLKISTIVQEIDPDHERASKWKVQNLVQETRHRRSYIVSNARDGLEDHRAMLTICRYDRRLLNNRGYVDNVRRRLTHKAKMLTTPLNILPEPIDYFYIYNKQDVFSFDQEEQYKKSEPALVTEPYVGQPLDRIIQKQGPLEEYGALSLTLQLCDLVEDLHRQHVLFYELRPEDILLDDSDHDRIWLVGGANFQTINKEGQVPIEDLVVPLSDFTYAAPEVEAGRVSLDKRSDYYSLGALLLFMLTGQKPREYLQSKKNYETIYGLDHLSPQTCELLDHCLALNPDDRFASINQIKKALRTARSALGITSPYQSSTCLSLATESNISCAGRFPRSTGRPSTAWLSDAGRRIWAKIRLTWITGRY